MYQFTETELAFWRELTAPFAGDAYFWREGSGGKKFTYLKSRTFMNRLDDVVGPAYWTDNYTATDKGVVCELTVILHIENGGYRSVTRSGLGGWADLGGDGNSEFKSAGTSAFVIACSKLGIGRDLYGEGMPDYWASKFGGFASGVPMQQLPGGAPDPGECQREENATTGGQHSPSSSPQQRAANSNNGNTGGGYGDAPPLGKTGKPVYAWSKKMSEKFSVDVTARMGDYAKKCGQQWNTNDWTQEFTDDCLAKTVEWLKTLDNYGGEFGEAVSPQSPTPVQSAAATKQAAWTDTSGTKKAIVEAVGLLLEKKFGRHASTGELVSAIGELGASTPNAKGHKGEVLESLKACEDVKWMAGILKAAQAALLEAAKLASTEAPAGSVDEIPF